MDSNQLSLFEVRPSKMTEVAAQQRLFWRSLKRGDRAAAGFHLDMIRAHVPPHLWGDHIEIVLGITRPEAKALLDGRTARKYHAVS